MGRFTVWTRDSEETQSLALSFTVFSESMPYDLN